MDTEYLNNGTVPEAKGKKLGLKLEQPASNTGGVFGVVSTVVSRILFQLGYSSLLHGAVLHIKSIMYVNSL